MTPAARRRRRALLLVLTIALITTVLPLVWPVPTLENVTVPEALAGPSSRFIEIDGIRVHYVESGEPDASCNVILLHGFGASTYSWRETLLSLGARCRVVAFDRPGFGLTERLLPGSYGPTNPYAIDSYVDQTISLMDALRMERAVLVGHSAGGTVAALVAARHPERVAGLVLEAPAIYSGSPVPGWLTPLLRSPQARRIGPLFARRIAGPASDDFVRGAFDDESVVTDEVLAGYRLPLEAVDWDRALWEVSAAPRPRNPEGETRGITVPTVVIYGAGDTYVSPADSERIAREIDGARAIKITRTGHIPHEERPAAFETELFRFIDDLEAAGVP